MDLPDRGNGFPGGWKRFLGATRGALFDPIRKEPRGLRTDAACSRNPCRGTKTPRSTDGDRSSCGTKTCGLLAGQALSRKTLPLEIHHRQKTEKYFLCRSGPDIWQNHDGSIAVARLPEVHGYPALSAGWKKNGHQVGNCRNIRHRLAVVKKKIGILARPNRTMVSV